MAKRFALSFGLDALKNREAITALHRDAILFATNPLENPNDPTGPPPNLAFLEIGAEFTNKLLKQDKRMVLQFLDRILTMGMPSSRGEEWQPLLLYRNSLVHGETDLPPQTARRAYGRRRRDAGINKNYFIRDKLLSIQNLASERNMLETAPWLIYNLFLPTSCYLTANASVKCIQTFASFNHVQ